MEVVAVVLGAGLGARLAAGRPKAHARVAGRTLLEWSTGSLARAPSVAGVLAVVPGAPEGGEDGAGLADSWKGPARLLAEIPGGSSRQGSLAAALGALAEHAPSASWVLVHDAARCLVCPEDAEDVLAAARATGAAIPVLPVEDTIKEVRGERVERTPPRQHLKRALTPQAFRLAILRQALEKARREHFEGTDCATLVERLGVEVRTCPGRAGNWKVTLPGDLERAELLLRARGDA